MRRDYDEEDDEDDRPRRRKKRRAPKKSSSMGLILGLVGGGVALLVLIGFGVGVSLYMNKPSANAGKPAGGGNSPAPIITPGGQPATSARANWADFRQADGLYSVKLPVAPHAGLLMPVNESRLMPFGSDKLSQVASQSQELAASVQVKVLSPASLAGEQKNLQAIGGNKRQVTWLGRTVVEESSDGRFGNVKRTFIDKDRLFVFDLRGLTGKPTDQEQATFFDSVVIH